MQTNNKNGISKLFGVLSLFGEMELLLNVLPN